MNMNEKIINEAVERFKRGEIKNNEDVENTCSTSLSKIT